MAMLRRAASLGGAVDLHGPLRIEWVRQLVEVVGAVGVVGARRDGWRG